MVKLLSPIISRAKVTLLRVIPTIAFQDISRHIFWHIFCDILSDILCDILHSRLRWQCPLRSGAHGWGLAVPTEIWRSRLRSGSAYWDLALAVEVWQCPLRSGAHGWGLAVPTEIWRSRLRSGSAHWDLALAVEVWQCQLRSGARGWGLALRTEIWRSRGPAVPTGLWRSWLRSGSAPWDLAVVEAQQIWSSQIRAYSEAAGKKGESGSNSEIKSRDPHLAGGEQTQSSRAIPSFQYLAPVQHILIEFLPQNIRNTFSEQNKDHTYPQKHHMSEKSFRIVQGCSLLWYMISPSKRTGSFYLLRHPVPGSEFGCLCGIVTLKSRNKKTHVIKNQCQFFDGYLSGNSHGPRTPLVISLA